MHTLQSLLSDHEDSIASLAIEQILELNQHSPQKCEKILYELQDSEDDITRRNVQQLGAILQQRKRMENFIHKFEQNRLGMFEAALALDTLYSPKSSPDFVKDMAQRLFSDYSGPLPMTPESVSSFMLAHNFSVPRPPWFNIGYYMLGDVLENGMGLPAILCIIAHALVHSRGGDCHLCLSNGQFCLHFPDNTLINPQNSWKVTPNVESGHFSICGVQQVIRNCLALALSYSLASWELSDAFFFKEILRRLDNLKGDFLHYPYGELHSPESTGPHSPRS